MSEIGVKVQITLWTAKLTQTVDMIIPEPCLRQSDSWYAPELKKVKKVGKVSSREK